MSTFMLGAGSVKAAEPEHIAPPALSYPGFLPLEQTLLGQLPEELIRRLQEYRLYDALKFWLLQMQSAANAPNFSLPGIVTDYGASSSITDMEFSPDGRLLIQFHRNSDYEAGSRGIMQIFDVHSHNLISTIPLERFLNVYSINGSLLAIGAHLSQMLRIWHIPSGKLIKSINLAAPITKVSLSSDNQFVAAALSDGTLWIWQISSESLVQKLRGHAELHSIAFSHDGRFIAGGSEDETIHIWDIATGNPIQILKKDIMPTGIFYYRGNKVVHRGGAPKLVSFIKFSPNGQLIASISGFNTVDIWDVATGTLITTIKHTSISSIAFSPDSRLLACAVKKEIILYNIASKKSVYTLLFPIKELDAIAHRVAFTSNGQHLVATAGQYACTWELYSPHITQYMNTLRFEAKLILNDLYQAYVDNNHYDLTDQLDILNYLNTLDVNLKKAINKLGLIKPALAETE
jgi:WD40 repeat protein